MSRTKLLKKKVVGIKKPFVNFLAVNLITASLLLISGLVSYIGEIPRGTGDFYVFSALALILGMFTLSRFDILESPYTYLFWLMVIGTVFKSNVLVIGVYSLSLLITGASFGVKLYDEVGRRLNGR